MTEVGEVLVEPEATGDRLDTYLARRFDEPRNRIQGWIAEGLVLVDGELRRPSHRLRGGERVAVARPPAPVHDPRIEPEPGPLVLLHEDQDLLVVDKPPGLAVHPGAGRSTGTLAHRLVARYPELVGVGGPGRPGIVHRLDLGTSGLLVVARTDTAYRALQRAFAARLVEKRYVGLCYGQPDPPRQVIDAPIGRHPGDRTRMAIRTGGRRAVTELRLAGVAGSVSCLVLAIETGRTHQIRVHLKGIGHPLLGDPTYGEARWKGLMGPARRAARSFPRPALHAWRLSFAHPTSGGRVAVEAPLPDDLVELWRDLGGTDLGERLASVAVER